MAKRTGYWRQTINHLLRGFVVMLPILATIAIITWLWGLFESILGKPLAYFLPEPGPEVTGPWCFIKYYPGMGSALCLIIILIVGMFVDAWLVRGLVNWAADMLDRIPLVKSIYGSLRDMMGFLTSGRSRQRASQVVLVRIGDTNIKMLGLLTRADLGEVAEKLGEDDRVAVYLPFSYALGGFTILVPRSAVEPVSMSIEEAMRFAVTAGMSTGGADKPSSGE